jgi:hypothetical protein
MILRFRDLVTEEGGTVAEHRSILKSHGEVWWGWWMRQYETPPREFFAELLQQIDNDGPVVSYLFNTGQGKLFSTLVAAVKVAPPGTTIGPPEPERTPEYYARGRYPAWFLLRSIDDNPFGESQFLYHSFPSRPEMHDAYKQFIDQPVRSLHDLRQIDVTIWVVRDSGSNP